MAVLITGIAYDVPISERDGSPCSCRGSPRTIERDPTGVPAIKGPGLKNDLDVRRLWRCPECGYERRVSGSRTAVRCRCASRPFMTLVGERCSRPSQNRPVDVYVSWESLVGDDSSPHDTVGTPTEDAAPGAAESVSGQYPEGQPVAEGNGSEGTASPAIEVAHHADGECSKSAADGPGQAESKSRRPRKKSRGRRRRKPESGNGHNGSSGNQGARASAKDALN